MTLNLLLLIAGLIICFGGIYIRRLCSAILGLGRSVHVPAHSGECGTLGL